MGREPYTRLVAWLSQAEGKNLEVIVVLDELAQSASPEFLATVKGLESSKFKVLKGKFGSPGSARNFGLDAASGEWIAFWDSDDLPNLENFIQMVELAELNLCEVSVGSFTWRSEGNLRELQTYINPKTVSQLINSVGRTPGIWRFAIRRNLLSQKFSNLQMAEDQEFLLANKYLSRKVFISSENVYEYFTGGNHHQTSLAANFRDLELALKLTYGHFSKAESGASRNLAALFWFQQFGSNLKYGTRLNRIKIFGLGVRQFIFSGFYFKKLVVLASLNTATKLKWRKNAYKVVVPLTGGLGNQLFQLSAAIAIADGARVGLDSSIGAPRLNQLGKPEISTFELPENVEFLPQKKRSKLIMKSSGYLLRMGVSPRKFENFSLYQVTLNLLWNILISLSYKKITICTAGKGVGYFPLRQRRFRQFIYGYFQSFVWPEISREKLQSIQLLNNSSQIKKYRELAQVESPLIVHIRLGDYKLESSFGIPSKNYYLEAISSLWSYGDYKKIWVFSDEPDLAIEYLPESFQSEIRWIPELDSSPSHTLEAMRVGAGYVIGNSTFSWWGAFLAYNSKVRVIAPRPWFRFGESPQALIPPGWKQIDAFKD
jgi:glycosyltransferase involved in cell wall biosynthesis